MWHDENTYVIRSDDIEKLKTFLDSFLDPFRASFVKEKHGDGPEHYACDVDGKVLEIYPTGGTS